MEQDTGDATPYGDPPAGPDGIGSDVIGSEAPSRRSRRGLAIAAGAAVLVVGGGAAAMAAGSAPSSTPSRTPTGAAGPSEGAPATPAAPGMRGGGLGRGLLGGGALHGELTVPGTGSTYEQVLVQRGTVTAVTPTSLAVKSADGYTHTYTLTSSTVVDGTKGDTTSLAVNDTVGVLAGSDSTARMVVEGRAHGMPFGGEHATPPSGSPEGGPPWPQGRLPGEGLRKPGGTPPGFAVPGAAPLAPAQGGSTT